MKVSKRKKVKPKIELLTNLNSPMMISFYSLTILS